MGIYSIRLPDVGEGVAEAELVEWHVKVGDTVLEDDIVGAVMTDKAAVEIPTSVTGKVTWLGGQIGDVIAVGAELIRVEIEGEGNVDPSVANSAPESNSSVAKDADVSNGVESPQSAVAEGTTDNPGAPGSNVSPVVDDAKLVNAVQATSPAPSQSTSQTVRTAPANGISDTKPLAAPSVRKHARDLGIDLRSVSGSGPAGRITREDIDSYSERGPVSSSGRVANNKVEEVKVIGLRRLIANKMSQSKKHIPHITIVEEIDVTSLEQTREELNTSYQEQRGKLTVLPFMMRAIVEAVREQPVINSLYDDEAEVISQYGGVHIGIATQTDNGLMVPVVRHSEVRSLWDNATEVSRLASACRDGSANRDELSGSTITITSLGALGAIATTPIINHPEVAIVGINKMVVRPVWDGQQFVPRSMMNISCSFDHRVVDGWDAAVMVQKIKTLLEKPAMLLVEA